jgi:hypothetical protein
MLHREAFGREPQRRGLPPRQTFLAVEPPVPEASVAQRVPSVRAKRVEKKARLLLLGVTDAGCKTQRTSMGDLSGRPRALGGPRVGLGVI